jgi:acetyl esterase/lipase
MKYLVVLLLSIFFVSCQKETQENTLAAETKMDVAYGSDPLQKMDIYLPAGRSTDSTKLIVLVHGGAWMEGDKADFMTYVSTLQQRFPGYAVANINYRLATTSANHFPVQETDMKSAIDYLVQKSSEYHITQKFVLLGASAGAHLAMLQAYKYPSPKIAGLIDFFGPADMVDMYTSSTSSINQLAIQILMSGTPATNPTLYQQSGPINFVTAQAPPTIIFHGGLDPLVPVSESTGLKNKLESLGVPTQLVIYPNLGHDLWPTATMNEAFDKIEVFIKANVH